ncbi:MAG TPA: hypothetical protein VKN82_07835 [Desulfohalobiaceae bacterium]|nr:hypothetical protein [Desulfohalobiaceae bacterium]
MEIKSDEWYNTIIEELMDIEHKMNDEETNQDQIYNPRGELNFAMNIVNNMMKKGYSEDENLIKLRNIISNLIAQYHKLMQPE